MLRNTIQHFLYHKQQEKDELSKLLKFLRIPIYTMIIFNIIEVIKKITIPDYFIFPSGYLFWSICILLIFYWMPNKKEYIEWKKIHSTF